VRIGLRITKLAVLSPILLNLSLDLPVGVNRIDRVLKKERKGEISLDGPCRLRVWRPSHRCRIAIISAPILEHELKPFLESTTKGIFWAIIVLHVTAGGSSRNLCMVVRNSGKAYNIMTNT